MTVDYLPFTSVRDRGYTRDGITWSPVYVEIEQKQERPLERRKTPLIHKSSYVIS